MFSLLAASLIASAPAERPARPAVQAIATARIVRGVALRLDGGANPDAPAPRPALVELERGKPKVRARLIEFE